MSKTPQFDQKVKEILEATSPGERTCELTGAKWEMTNEEISWYKKFNVPPSKWAPQTRMRLVYGFASGIALWWKSHAKTGKPILSFIHPDSPYQVITDKEWITEEFLRKGPEIDSTKPFMDQFRELAFSVPVGSMRDDGTSLNTVGVDHIKCEDSYLIFSQPENKRCMYTALSLFSDDSVDSTNAHNSQFCYRTNKVSKLFKCRFAFESRDCMNSSFLFDCRNCEFCFGATNKRNKKYLWFNEQLTQEEYEKRLAEVDLSCYSKLQEYEQKFQALVKDAMWPENFNIGAMESTGEYLEESTRCHNSFWVRKSNDLYNC